MLHQVEAKRSFGALVGRISTLALEPTLPVMEEINDLYNGLDTFTSQILDDRNEWKNEESQAIEELLLAIATQIFVEFLEEAEFETAKGSAHAFETSQMVREKLLVHWDPQNARQ